MTRLLKDMPMRRMLRKAGDLRRACLEAAASSQQLVAAAAGLLYDCAVWCRGLRRRGRCRRCALHLPLALPNGAAPRLPRRRLRRLVCAAPSLSPHLPLPPAAAAVTMTATMRWCHAPRCVAAPAARRGAARGGRRSARRVVRALSLSSPPIRRRRPSRCSRRVTVAMQRLRSLRRQCSCQQQPRLGRVRVAPAYVCARCRNHRPPMLHRARAGAPEAVPRRRLAALDASELVPPTLMPSARAAPCARACRDCA